MLHLSHKSPFYHLEYEILPSKQHVFLPLTKFIYGTMPMTRRLDNSALRGPPILFRSSSVCASVESPLHTQNTLTVWKSGVTFT